MNFKKYFLIYFIILSLIAFQFFVKIPSIIYAFILLSFLYLLYIWGFKFLPKYYYVINILFIFAIIFNFIKFGNKDFLLLSIIILQLIILIFAKQIWQKYREKHTFTFSANVLKDMIERNFNLEKKLYQIQQENLELEKQKIFINRIYSEAKLINQSIKLYEILEICKNILEDIIKLPNFVLLIKEKNGSFSFYIKQNITEKMEEYLNYFISNKKYENLFNLSSYASISLSDEIEFKKRFNETDLRNLNIFPLVMKDKVIGSILSFGYLSKLIEKSTIEIISEIASPIIAMGINKALLHKEMEDLSRRDGLTKLYLHRVFQEKILEEFARAKRYKTTFSLIMIDIDHFKNFNDNYGHLIGDTVLATIANIIKENIEEPSFAARYGGEEFAIVCPNLKLDEAFELAEKIRKKVENEKIKIEDNFVNVTISAGVAQFSEGMISKDEIIKLADDALYKAKNSGRNRTIKAE